MIQDKEKVSIIIATHNNAKTIERALRSVTMGRRPADQIVVGDNDSSDGTYDVLCKLLDAKQITIKGKTGLPPEFEDEFDGVPIKIFRKKLSTIGHTLNIAMQMKWQGMTIFGFLDPASWYAPYKISQAIRIFQTQPSVACVVSDCDNHYLDGRIERIFRCSFDIQKLLAKSMYDRNFLIRPQVFSKLKDGFNEQLPIRDDYDFLLRISEIGLIYHIPAPLHHNSIIEVDEAFSQSIIQCETAIRQSIMHRRNQSNA